MAFAGGHREGVRAHHRAQEARRLHRGQQGVGRRPRRSGGGRGGRRRRSPRPGRPPSCSRDPRASAAPSAHGQHRVGAPHPRAAHPARGAARLARRADGRRRRPRPRAPRPWRPGCGRHRHRRPRRRPSAYPPSRRASPSSPPRSRRPTRTRACSSTSSGWDAAEEDVPPPPPSAAIAVPPHKPPLRHTDPPNELPSVIVGHGQGARGPGGAAGGRRRRRAGRGRAAAPGRAGDARADGVLPRAAGVRAVAHRGRQPGAAAERVRPDPAPRDAASGRWRCPSCWRSWAIRTPRRAAGPRTSLVELPYPEAIAPLLLRLRDVDLSTRVSASHALAAVARLYPEEVRAGVLALARSADPIDRSAAMRVMGELREPVLVPELVRALGDGDEAVGRGGARRARAGHAAGLRPRRAPLAALVGAERVAQPPGVAHRRADARDLRDPPRGGRGAAGAQQGVLRLRERSAPARPRRAQQRYRDWWVTEGRARFRRKV